MNSIYGHRLLDGGQFLLRKGLINLNHGSFGTVPNSVFERHCALLREQESCPEVWFRETYFAHVTEARAKVAQLINSSIDEVVLVENASYAVNSILRSMDFKVLVHILLLL